MHQQDKTDPARLYPIPCHPHKKKRQTSSMGEEEEHKRTKKNYLQREKGERIRKGNSTSNGKAGEISKNKPEIDTCVGSGLGGKKQRTVLLGSSWTCLPLETSSSSHSTKSLSLSLVCVSLYTKTAPPCLILIVSIFLLLWLKKKNNTHKLKSKEKEEKYRWERERDIERGREPTH